MKIQAAVLHKVESPFSLETLDLAEPREGEVLLRMLAAGVCRSDWHLVTGATRHPLPVVPGHEGSGRVEAVGPGVDSVRPGDLVTLNWAPACRNCFYCRVGKPNLCATYLDPIWAGTLLDGTVRLALNGQPVYHFCGLAAFAECVVVPEASCVCMDANLAPTIAALIGCAVATGVGAVLNTAKVQQASSVAVFGAGGVGLNIVLAARLAGAEKIIVVDPEPARRELAQRCGATVTIGDEANPVQAVREATEGRGADYTFEAVGQTAVQEQALEAARPGGTVVLAGLAPMDSTTRLPGAVITRQEKTVVGSYYGSTDPARDFPQYGRYYLDGKLDLDHLISNTYRLDQINEAYDDMLGARIARGMILFDR